MAKLSHGADVLANWVLFIMPAPFIELYYELDLLLCDWLSCNTVAIDDVELTSYSMSFEIRFRNKEDAIMFKLQFSEWIA